MNKKQVIVNVCLVLVLIATGWFCYRQGKTYTILLENLPYETGGEKQTGLEAIYAYIDNGRQVFMLEGDRTAVSGSGSSHVLKIEMLDEEDKVLETREIPFSMSDLGERQSVNVARAYREGSVEAPSQ